MNTEKDILLRRIANHLILHSIDIEDHYCPVKVDK